MEQKKLQLYQVDIKYVRDLAKVDDNVLSVSPQEHKETRPFVGVIIVCKDKQYCVPLSSPKAKHQSMKNDVDFTKIIYRERLIGVLNFNNMIPVAEEFIFPIDMKVRANDGPNEKHYKELMANQLAYCQQNQDAIVKKANRLYNMVISGKANGMLKKRCCDFEALEKILDKKLEQLAKR